MTNEIYTSCFQFKTHNSYSLLSHLCCGGYFSNITFIDAKTKDRSPYLLAFLTRPNKDVWEGRLRDVSEGRPQVVVRTHPLELHIRPYGDVFIASAGDVLKTPIGTSLGITYRAKWEGPQNVSLGCLQDVNRQRPLALHRGPYWGVHNILSAQVLSCE